MTPFQASENLKEKEVHSNLKDNKEVRRPKIRKGLLVRTADIKKVFSKGDSSNYSYKLYTTTEVIYDTIPLYRIICLRDIMNTYYYHQNYLMKKTIN